MAYEKQTWANNVTPLDADHMNHIENGIAESSTEIEKLKSDIADLKYAPIKITSFGCSPNVVEIGSIVNTVTLSWSVNKTPTMIMLDGIALDSGITNTRLDDLELTRNKTWTLQVVDEREMAASSNASITYLNGVYYGVAAATDNIDSTFILGLTKTLSNSKLSSFSVNAGAGQYIWYCVPSRFGSCKFKVGGFDGGFNRLAVLSFTNASGYTENYDVYRSANAGLGNTTVGVS